METLDPQVVNLAKAIRQSESGGDFNAKGKSGEHGAYQFTEPTWSGASKKYGVNITLKDATPEQQNEVAYKQIKEWKDAGHNVGQIASMWNAGEGEPDAYKGTFSNGKPATGTNKFGAKYDVPAYAKSVATAYQSLKNGGQVGADPNNPSSIANNGTTTPQTFEEYLKKNPNIAIPQSQISDTTAPGNFLSDLSKGKIGAALQSGVRDFGNAITGGGTETLGKVLGTAGGAIATKAKDIVKGTHNYDNYDLSAPSPTQTLSAGIKTVGAALGIKGGARLLGGFLAKSSALANPEVKAVLESVLGKGETLANLSRQDAINTLGNTLKEMSVSESGGKKEQLILRALKELNPTLIEKKSLLKKVGSGVLNTAKGLALTKILGDTVGGFIHKNTP